MRAPRPPPAAAARRLPPPTLLPAEAAAWPSRPCAHRHCRPQGGAVFALGSLAIAGCDFSGNGNPRLSLGGAVFYANPAEPARIEDSAFSANSGFKARARTRLGTSPAFRSSETACISPLRR